MIDLNQFTAISPERLQRFRLEAKADHLEVAIAQHTKDVSKLERELPRAIRAGATREQIKRIERAIETGRLRIVQLRIELRFYVSQLALLPI